MTLEFEYAEESSGGEAESIQRVLAGERELYGSLVERYRDRLYTVLFGILRDHHTTMELVQETFLRAFRSLGLYDPRYRFSSWLFRIGVNLALNQAKRRKLERRVLDRSVDVTRLGRGSAGVPSDTEAAETKREVWKAIAKLPENYRLPMVLRYFEELSCKEIAEVLQVTPNTVSINLHRARKMLRAHLEGYVTRKG